MSGLDRKIDRAEKQVLLYQSRIIEQKEKANALVKRLENESRELEEVKKEWIKKRNLEEERIRLELCDLKKAHRHGIEDLRVKYELERENKLRELKIRIHDEEKVIEELQKKRSEVISKTMVERSQIDARHQVKLNELLREEQSASRRGVVRQKRLLGAPNVYSMELERSTNIGMKKRQHTYRRDI